MDGEGSVNRSEVSRVEDQGIPFTARLVLEPLGAIHCHFATSKRMK